MNDSGIEWCDYTWNPIVGCTHGCEFCYARRIMKRRKPGTRRDAEGRLENYGCQACYSFVPHLHPERLDQPARVKSPRIVFCGSVTDLFGPGVHPNWRWDVWAAMNAAPWHHYVVLTKRPDLIDGADLWETVTDLNDPDRGPGGLWLGVSVTCDADWWRVERLIEVTRKVCCHAIVSFEPLLGPITHDIPEEIEWVIVGAQTGPGAAEWRVSWVEDLEERLVPSDLRPWPDLFEKDSLHPGLGVPVIQNWPAEMVRATVGKARRPGGGDVGRFAAGDTVRVRADDNGGRAGKPAPPRGNGDGNGAVIEP